MQLWCIPMPAFTFLGSLAVAATLNAKHWFRSTSMLLLYFVLCRNTCSQYFEMWVTCGMFWSFETLHIAAGCHICSSYRGISFHYKLIGVLGVVCFCMCVCMYVCMFVYVCMYVCTYIHICVYIYIHAHIYVCTYIHIHTYIHTFIHTYIHTQKHTYIHTYLHTHTHTHIGR